MPTYDFVCRSCKAQFEALVLGSKTPACPECRSEDLERLLSFPTVKSDTTRDVIKRETRRRDAASAKDRTHEQAKYERNHD